MRQVKHIKGFNKKNNGKHIKAAHQSASSLILGSHCVLILHSHVHLCLYLSLVLQLQNPSVPAQKHDGVSCFTQTQTTYGSTQVLHTDTTRAEYVVRSRTHIVSGTHVPVLFKEVQLHVMLNIICLSIFINLCFYIKGKRDER